MKRSEINLIIDETVVFFREMNFRLPKWAYWTTAEWHSQKDRVKEIVECGLGWDITDFGSGDFRKIGLVNFNLRNGVLNRTRKNYCEKIIVVEENQVTPLHTHYMKLEDIIVRGGGNLVVQLYQGDDGYRPTDQPVTARIDSIPQTVPPGGKVVLTPGESIFLEPGMLHLFYAEPGSGRALVGEVSTVNDDLTDNYFVVEAPRFPTIDEDVMPEFLLVNDYPKFL